ncbi:MAG: SDR family oxidoreductase [Desulfosoma sp.]
MEFVYKKLREATHLIVFGLGAQFRNCYRQLVLALGREPSFLCDNDQGKWGQTFFGKLCLSPSELPRLASSAPTVVVVTIRRYEPVVAQLHAMEIPDVFVACFDRGYDYIFGIKPPDTKSPFQGALDCDDRILADKWSFITGSTRGIGKTIAVALAGLGSNVILHGRSLDHTHEVAQLCRKKEVEVRTIAADFAIMKQVEVMLETLETEYPPVDILYNNAGICLTNGQGTPSWAIWWSISTKEYLHHYMVNTLAPILITNHLVPQMLTRGYGRVITISSTIERQPDAIAYACSKAALNKFVHDLAPTLHGTDVSMCLVCPGHVLTDMGGPSAPHKVETVIPGAILGAVMDASLNGRWIMAQDYAGLSLSQAIQKAQYYYGLP